MQQPRNQHTQRSLSHERNNFFISFRVRCGIFYFVWCVNCVVLFFHFVCCFLSLKEKEWLRVLSRKSFFYCPDGLLCRKPSVSFSFDQKKKNVKHNAMANSFRESKWNETTKKDFYCATLASTSQFSYHLFFFFSHKGYWTWVPIGSFLWGSERLEDFSRVKNWSRALTPVETNFFPSSKKKSLCCPVISTIRNLFPLITLWWCSLLRIFFACYFPRKSYCGFPEMSNRIKSHAIFPLPHGLVRVQFQLIKN